MSIESFRIKYFRRMHGTGKPFDKSFVDRKAQEVVSFATRKLGMDAEDLLPEIDGKTFGITNEDLWIRVSDRARQILRH